MTQKPVVMGPPKITRASKKNKKSWRVNIDVTEVEDKLEEERFNERIGGGHEKKKDEDLFMLDSAGAEKENEEKERLRKKKEEEKKAPAYSENLSRVKAKKFKCFALLDGLPGADDPIAKRRKQPMSKEAVKQLEEKDKKLVSQIDKIRKSRQKAMDEKKKRENIDEDSYLRTKFAHDLWDDQDPDVKKNEVDELLLNDQWVKPNTKVYIDINTRKHVPKVNMQKNKTLVPAVELPHSGQSYNPSVEEHQEILWKAAMIEIEKERKAKKLERVLTGMFPTEGKAPTYKEYLEEMAQGIPELGGKVEESDDDDDAEGEDEAGFTKEGTKLKTRQKRRREMLRKREEYLRKKAKAEKIEMDKIVSVKTYKKIYSA
jgi:nucleolar protein 53